MLPLLRILFLCLLFPVGRFTALAQSHRAVEARLSDLPGIQLRYGTDSVRQLVNDTPIWLVNQKVALALLQAPDCNFLEMGWAHYYLLEIGTAVRAAEVAPLLEKLLSNELQQAEQVNTRRNYISWLNSDILLGYLHQQSPNAEAVLFEQLNRYVLIRQKLEAGPRTGLIVRVLFQDLVESSKANVELTIYKYLLALHAINPAKFSQSQIEAQRSRIKALFEVEGLKTFPEIKPASYKIVQIAVKQITIDGVTMPEELVGKDTGLTEPCSIIKLIESDNIYFLEQSCHMVKYRSGLGSTHLIRIKKKQ